MRDHAAANALPVKPDAGYLTGKTTLALTATEQCDLWRQRAFENLAGMERYVTMAYGRDEIPRWLQFRNNLHLNHPLPADGDLQAWKAFFFRIQAALEKYLVNFHGLEDIGQWAAEIGDVFASVEPADYGNACAPALRLASVAQSYGSVYEIKSLDSNQANLEISSCAIYRYREQARKAGVQLTLDRPCTFCTKAVGEIARATGVTASVNRFQRGDNHGCSWSFARSVDGGGK
jgi:hypothetical protein